MIMGNNNNFGKPNFVSHNNQLNGQSQTTNQNNTINTKPSLNPANEKASTMYHSNIMSKEDMTNKSFAMLQERLSNGTITIEEFNRKCAELGKHSK